MAPMQGKINSSRMTKRIRATDPRQIRKDKSAEDLTVTMTRYRQMPRNYSDSQPQVVGIEALLS